MYMQHVLCMNVPTSYYEASFSFFANVSHDHDTHAGKMLPLVHKEKWDNTQCSLILTDPYVLRIIYSTYLPTLIKASSRLIQAIFSFAPSIVSFSQLENFLYIQIGLYCCWWLPTHNYSQLLRTTISLFSLCTV